MKGVEMPPPTAQAKPKKKKGRQQVRGADQEEKKEADAGTEAWEPRWKSSRLRGEVSRLHRPR